LDPSVEVLEVTQPSPNRLEVKVRLAVKDLRGNLIARQNVMQVFTVANGLIQRMDGLPLLSADPLYPSPSTARVAPTARPTLPLSSESLKDACSSSSYA
jgi:hypothetical protein